MLFFTQQSIGNPKLYVFFPFFFLSFGEFSTDKKLSVSDFL
jgi:hypothetical protein